MESIFIPSPAAPAFVLKLFNRLAKHVFLFPGKALRALVVWRTGLTGHVPPQREITAPNA